MAPDQKAGTMSDALKVHRWTQDGQEWACAAYDHGPHCRLCRRVDDTLAGILTLVDEGKADIVSIDKAGEMSFRLTDAGMAAAREVIVRMGADPDDGDSILDALRPDPKNN